MVTILLAYANLSYKEHKYITVRDLPEEIYFDFSMLLQFKCVFSMVKEGLIKLGATEPVSFIPSPNPSHFNVFFPLEDDSRFKFGPKVALIRGWIKDHITDDTCPLKLICTS